MNTVYCCMYVCMCVCVYVRVSNNRIILLCIINFVIGNVSTHGSIESFLLCFAGSADQCSSVHKEEYPAVFQFCNMVLVGTTQ